MDSKTREILKDRMRYQQDQGNEFTDFLKTIDWNYEPWAEEYENRQDDLFSDLLDIWNEVKEEV